MIFLWDHHGISMRCRVDGTSMGLLWGFKRISIGLPLNSYGISMIFLWDFFGISMIFLLDFYDISFWITMGFLLDSCEISM